MDFLARLEMLMKTRKLNKAQLAAQAGLPKTTVYGWWNSGYENMTITTLKTLSRFFSCTLDYLVNGDETERASVERAREERDLVAAYWEADECTRKYAVEMLRNHPKKNQQPESAHLA